MNTDYTGQGVDQLKNIIETIRKNPNDRRMIMCAWNPVDIPKMALPPCHCLVQFYVVDNKLSCLMYQRSADMGLGVPFNIASYSLLTYMIAHLTGTKVRANFPLLNFFRNSDELLFLFQPNEFIHMIGDCHIYSNHVEALKSQLTRDMRPFPTISISRKVTDIDDFRFDDFVISDYNPHEKISMDMAV